MVKPILFYAEFSPAARTVLQTIRLLNIDVELRYFDYARKENVTEEFINPQHTVPTLIDDGEALYDCHAIITYLQARYADNDRLYPAGDLQLRARIDQRLYFNAGCLTPLLRQLVTPVLYEGASQLDERTVAETLRVYDQMENYLVRHYLCGQHMTLADVACASTLYTIEHLVPVDGDLYPRIQIWLQWMTAVRGYDEVQLAGAKQLALGLRRYMELNGRRRTYAEAEVEAERRREVRRVRMERLKQPY